MRRLVLEPGFSPFDTPHSEQLAAPVHVCLSLKKWPHSPRSHSEIRSLVHLQHTHLQEGLEAIFL